MDRLLLLSREEIDRIMAEYKPPAEDEATWREVSGRDSLMVDSWCAVVFFRLSKGKWFLKKVAWWIEMWWVTMSQCGDSTIFGLKPKVKPRRSLDGGVSPRGSCGRSLQFFPLCCTQAFWVCPECMNLNHPDEKGRTASTTCSGFGFLTWTKQCPGAEETCWNVALTQNELL